ncbi:CDGSH iron-sulfur domain-containing protein [Actinomadura coerulea]
MTWQTGDAMATEDTYALCRCGRSAAKPLCDGTHREIGFREAGPGAEPRPAGDGGTTEKGRKA